MPKENTTQYEAFVCLSFKIARSPNGIHFLSAMFADGFNAPIKPCNAASAIYKKVIIR